MQIRDSSGAATAERLKLGRDDMSNAPFTRDEVILALDTLYSSGKERLSPDDDIIQELSILLNNLPVVHNARRNINFRNQHGITQQINGFARTYPIGKKDQNVGTIFYQIADEYFDRKDELHAIAETVRRNREFFQSAQFGDIVEAGSFPEGALISHLHRYLEARDSCRAVLSPVCEVCRLDLGQVYKNFDGGFTQAHLLVPLTQLDAAKKYSGSDFITVCPNCHAVLHKLRPWADRTTAAEILR